MFKSTITVYSELDPRTVELVELAQQATDGDVICTQHAVCEVNADELPASAASFFEDIR